MPINHVYSAKFAAQLPTPYCFFSLFEDPASSNFPTFSFSWKIDWIRFLKLSFASSSLIFYYHTFIIRYFPISMKIMMNNRKNLFRTNARSAFRNPMNIFHENAHNTRYRTKILYDIHSLDHIKTILNNFSNTLRLFTKKIQFI